MKIIIGIPAFNEEKIIASIITKLMNITDSIIVCNDGSSDLTSEIAEKMGAVVINHEKNLGYGAAIRSIFLKAKELDGDILVTFDADGQHRIEDLETVLTALMKVPNPSSPKVVILDSRRNFEEMTFELMLVL